MEFPKDRGDWTGEGRTDARFLREQFGTGWLTKNRGAGYEARLRGDRMETDEGEEPVAAHAFYIYGAEAGVRRIHGSTSARGSFVDIGEPPFDSMLYINQLVQIGNGQALQLEYRSERTQVNSAIGEGAGWVVPSDKFYWHWTSNGKDMTLIGDFNVIGARTDSVIGMVLPGGLQIATGAYANGGAAVSFAFDSLDEFGQHCIMFYRDDGGTLFQKIIDLEEWGQLTIRSFDRIGPKAFMCCSAGVMFVPPILWAYGGTEATPLCTFTVSLDNGETWTRLVDPPFIEAEQAIWRTARDDHWFDPITWINSYWSHLFCQAVPLNATQAIVYLCFPCLRSADGINPLLSGNAKAVAKVFRGLYTAGGTITHLDSIPFEALSAPDYEADERAFAFWERNALPVPGGVVYMVTQDVNNYKNVPFDLVFTPTGGPPYTVTGASPAAAGLCGVVTMIDPQTMVLPVFDGEYSLYQSKNLGATWTKRALISTDGAVPSIPAGGYQTTPMTNYGVLNFLRRNGAAANTTPGTPWASDDRIAPP